MSHIFCPGNYTEDKLASFEFRDNNFQWWSTTLEFVLQLINGDTSPPFYNFPGNGTR